MRAWSRLVVVAADLAVVPVVVGIEYAAAKIETWLGTLLMDLNPDDPVRHARLAFLEG